MSLPVWPIHKSSRVILPAGSEFQTAGYELRSVGYPAYQTKTGILGGNNYISELIPSPYRFLLVYLS